MNLRTKRIIAGLSVAGAAFLMLFQNCGGSFLSAKSSSSLDLPFGHPGTEPQIASGVAKGSLPMGDIDYVHSVLADVFHSANPDVLSFISAMRYEELGEIQAMMGRPCEVSTDGSYYPCNNSLSNIDVAMGASTSSIREAARIQVCRRYLANDTMLSVAIGNARDGSVGEPDAQAVAKAIRMFYPASDEAQNVLGDLMNLDTKMKSAGETSADRWRMIFLTLCESPGWQVL